VLPQWSADWPEYLLEKFPNQESYQNWFMHFIGIQGDPVRGMRLVNWAKARGVQLNFSPYDGAPRAFKVNPSSDDLEIMKELMHFIWGDNNIGMLDPFAGGGSIPFEALRYGLTTMANDLNPVAAVILKATMDYPARFGPSLAEEIIKWGNIWSKRVHKKLKLYFPTQPNENIFAYLWARTIQYQGKMIPLSPNWWLQKSDPPIAVRLITEGILNVPRFEIVTGAKAIASNPDVGTISRGVGRSPWTGETIDGDFIKAEAQAGRMGQVLYAVVLKEIGGFKFRNPGSEDYESVEKAESTLILKKAEWIRENILPVEQFPGGNDNRPLIYGMPTWVDFFSPRQLLSIGFFAEYFRELGKEIQESIGAEKAKAIQTYLGIMLDKAVIYNNRSCRFDPSRGIRSSFDRHDFAFVASHAEFDASANLIPWMTSQIADAYEEIANLAAPSQYLFSNNSLNKTNNQLLITQGSAINLNSVADSSIFNITVDPPYYDNVQYAELSDFFYVWLKRSVGHLFPEFFQDELTNKDDEAVANPARFEGMRKKKNELAEQDYERKMAAAFKEMHRVLRPDGVLTVMFTHKRVEAWDTLASALIGAGFTIKASWPIHTESEHSLHQAKKNAASSTILLVCRKREVDQEQSIWWDDIKENVRQVARQKAQEFSEQGIHGVDLYLSTFGPTLSILSERWPVLTSEVDPKTGQPRPLRPEVALDLAREEVVRLRKQGLLLGREVAFDPVTDWYLMAWDAFKAEQFPYDEARKLAIALGIDLDGHLMTQKRLVTKKGAKKSSYVILQTPIQRRKKDMVDDEINSFVDWVDAAHTAMMVYQEDGPGACDAFLQRSGLKRDSIFKACLQAMINAIPASRIKGKFVRPEAEVLENMRLAFFDDLQPPKEEEPEMPEGVQLGLWEAKDEEDEGEEE